jgi:hypothetical protein
LMSSHAGDKTPAATRHFYDICVDTYGLYRRLISCAPPALLLVSLIFQTQ